MQLFSSLQKKQPSVSQESTMHFMRFCEEVSLIASSYNIKLEPYNEKGLTQFATLGLDKQCEILDALKKYIQQLHKASANKVDLTGDNRQHAWWLMRNLDYNPPSDVFDQIDKSDMIEIYDESCIQIFRSFELYNYMSYSFSEIFCFTWMDLFKRDEFVLKRMIETVTNIMTGNLKEAVKPNFPVHYAEEIFSKSKIWIKMESGLISPLRGIDGSIRGFLYTFKIPEHGYNTKA